MANRSETSDFCKKWWDTLTDEEKVSKTPAEMITHLAKLAGLRKVRPLHDADGRRFSNLAEWAEYVNRLENRVWGVENCCKVYANWGGWSRKARREAGRDASAREGSTRNTVVEFRTAGGRKASANMLSSSENELRAEIIREVLKARQFTKQRAELLWQLCGIEE